jgi:hypothetical protein
MNYSNSTILITFNMAPELPPIPSGLIVLRAFETRPRDLLSTSSSSYTIKAFGQRVALKAASTTLYNAKDLARGRLQRLCGR